MASTTRLRLRYIYVYGVRMFQMLGNVHANERKKTYETQERYGKIDIADIKHYAGKTHTSNKHTSSLTNTQLCLCPCRKTFPKRAKLYVRPTQVTAFPFVPAIQDPLAESGARMLRFYPCLPPRLGARSPCHHYQKGAAHSAPNAAPSRYVLWNSSVIID